MLDYVYIDSFTIEWRKMKYFVSHKHFLYRPPRFSLFSIILYFEMILRDRFLLLSPLAAQRWSSRRRSANTHRRTGRSPTGAAQPGRASGSLCSPSPSTSTRAARCCPSPASGAPCSSPTRCGSWAWKTAWRHLRTWRCPRHPATLRWAPRGLSPGTRRCPAKAPRRLAAALWVLWIAPLAGVPWTTIRDHLMSCCLLERKTRTGDRCPRTPITPSQPPSPPFLRRWTPSLTGARRQLHGRLSGPWRTWWALAREPWRGPNREAGVMQEAGSSR